MSGSDNTAQFDAGKYPDHIAYDHKVALQTFEDIAKGGRLHIAAIPADPGPVAVRAFQMPQQRTDIVVFLRTIDVGQQANSYFCPNESGERGGEMPDEGSVTTLRAVIVDIDPMDTTSEEAWIAERLRIKKLVHATIGHPHLRPTLAIDTGNGAQLVYLLNREPAGDMSIPLMINTMRALARRFGGDPRAAHKASGLFRIPGTRNVPNASKAKRGRHVAYGGIWHRDISQVYDLKTLYTLAIEGQPEHPDDKPDEEKNPGAVGLTLNQLIDQSRDLPDHIAYRIQAKSSDHRVFREHLTRMGDPLNSSDRSKDDYRFVLMLLADNFTPAEAAVCLGFFGATKAQPQYSDRWVRYVIGTVLNAVAAAPKTEDFWAEPEPGQAEAKSEPPPKDEPKADERKRWFSAAELVGLPFGGDRPLVDRLLPKRGLSMIYGESNTGKSLVALDICACVASGTPFGGRAVNATGLVVYIAMEGGGGLHKRLKALVRRYPDRNLDRLLCIIEPFSLRDSSSPDIKSLAEILRDIRKAHDGAHIDLLVIDMLAIAASGANENSGEDMSKVLDQIGKIEQALTCHVMTLHHTGKNLNKGARGWSGIRGRVDTEIEIGTTKIQKNGTLTVTKQRDMDFNPNDKQGYMIRSVHLGNDDDRAVSGAVIELIEVEIGDEDITKPTEAEQMVLDCLQQIGTPATAAELAASLHKTTRAILHLLKILITKKQVIASNGKPRRYMPYMGFDDIDEDDNGPVDPFS